MAQYVTSSEFTEIKTGVQTTDLAAGILDKYLTRASALVDQYCNRTFVAQTAVVEQLFTNYNGRARIAPNGVLVLYPLQAYPITTVTSITWKLRILALTQQTTSSSTPQSITVSTDVVIHTDPFNDGFKIVCYDDFGQYRDPDTVVQVTLTYNGGYSTYPDWLKLATLEVAEFILKRRGSQSIVLGGPGQSVSMADWASEAMSFARMLLDPHKRII